MVLNPKASVTKGASEEQFFTKSAPSQIFGGEKIQDPQTTEL